MEGLRRALPRWGEVPMVIAAGLQIALAVVMPEFLTVLNAGIFGLLTIGMMWIARESEKMRDQARKMYETARDLHAEANDALAQANAFYEEAAKISLRR